MALNQRINKDVLLAKIGDQNIFNFYFGEIEMGKSYHSVFRKDEKKSTGFYVNDKGQIIYKDFATSDSYGAIQFVMRLLGVSYYVAIKQIAADFGLINGNRSSSKVAAINVIKTPVIKPQRQIRIDTDGFKSRHLRYWLQYGITKEELIENNVFAVRNLYIDGKQITTKQDEVKFAYVIRSGEDEYVKIYSPYDTEHKWLSNSPLNVPFGLEDLPLKSHTLIITKGQKDRILLKKWFTEVISLQNESPAALKPETAKALKKVYKTIYIWFDCDRPGIKAANFYKKQYGFIPIFTANHKQNIWANIIAAKANKIKDPSDFTAYYGIETFKQYLEYKNLL